MRESMRVIKWCSVASIVFLVLTYAVTVNSEAHFISVDSIWISNSFLITLFGGAFASVLVVLLCEIQKYLSLKANTEQYLFCQSLYLYQTLMQMKVVIEDFFKHCEWQIPENLLDDSIAMIKGETNAIQATDYATFSHDKDSLMVEHERFRKEALQIIQPLFQSGIRLKLAIKETEMEYLRKQMETHDYLGSRKLVTSESTRVAKTLSSEVDIVTSSIALVDSYIDVLDKRCHERFKWHDVKSKLEFPHLDDLGFAESSR